MSKKKKSKARKERNRQLIDQDCENIRAGETMFLEWLDTPEGRAQEILNVKLEKVTGVEPSYDTGQFQLHLETSIGPVTVRIRAYDSEAKFLAPHIRDSVNAAIRRRQRELRERLAEKVAVHQENRLYEWQNEKKAFLQTLNPHLTLRSSDRACQICYEDEAHRFVLFCVPSHLPPALLDDIAKNPQTIADEYIENLNGKFREGLERTQPYTCSRQTDLQFGHYDGPDVLFRSRLSQVSFDYKEIVTLSPFSYTLADSEGKRIETSLEQYVLSAEPKVQKYVDETASGKFSECLEYARAKLDELNRQGFAVERKTKDGLLSGKGDFTVSYQQGKPVRMTLNIPPYRRKTEEWKQGIDAFFAQIETSYSADLTALTIAQTEEALALISTFAERDMAKIVTELEAIPEFVLVGHLLGKPKSRIQKSDAYNDLYGRYKNFYTEKELTDLIQNMDARDIIRCRYVHGYGWGKGDYDSLYKLKTAAKLNILEEKRYSFDKDKLLVKCRDQKALLTDFEAEFLYRLLAEQESMSLPDYMMLIKTIRCRGFMAEYRSKVFNLFKEAPAPVLTLLKALIMTEPCPGTKKALEKSELKDLLPGNPEKKADSLTESK